ncbi:beta-glucosidase 24-like [Cucurbita moschata]|uniref:Beta-glucosidase 24-like n=1 Tax=Cucurbita moschata TaxID=3662 RepID=A0A6J1H894_CUCMO|nr:beta-glucosidase 24-like [Cucurbita moschata]
MATKDGYIIVFFLLNFVFLLVGAQREEDLAHRINRRDLPYKYEDGVSAGGMKNWNIYNPTHPAEVQDDDSNHVIKRSDFPEDFIFGAASSAYQYEGGISTRGINNWDIYTHKYKERIVDRSNGDVAVDQIHRYKEDLSFMQETGFHAYRFSISWTRILRDGTLEGGLNKEGIEYYNNLIDDMISKGITPMVTLFHWEIPQAFVDEYGGFLSSRIMKDFTDFVDVCFREFGDRVKHWITVNEPNTYTMMGYALGQYPPGRCSEWQIHNCLGGNAATEPYIVGHNLILAHAHAVKVYRDKYQKTQKGVIGITVLADWYVPLTDTPADIEAANRAVDFFSGWFFNPVVHGNYPETMISRVKERLPHFTEEQRILIKGSYDFLGVNYYTSNYAKNDDKPAERPSYLTDSGAISLNEPSLGPKVNASSWLAVYPQGLKDTLMDIKRKYNDPIIYITENGYFDYDGPNVKELIDDKKRAEFYNDHLYYLHKAMEDGVKVKGFFAWTLLDDFEWQSGYTQRFGLIYIDFLNDLKRIPKLSLKWFANFLKN